MEIEPNAVRKPKLKWLTVKKAIAYLDFNDTGWFIPPAYDGGSLFSFRGMELIEDTKFELNVYPNPSSVILNFSVLNTVVEEDYSIVIFDSTGKLIQILPMQSYQEVVTINTSNWASGLYGYNVVQEGEKIASGSFEIIH